MDKLILNGTNGFPLHTDTLAEAQRAWNIFNAISGITGDLTILQGCEQRGSTVSDGVVIIKGEVLNFKGGAVMPKVIIEEKITERAFKDKNKKPVFATRTAKFGVGSETYNWSDFKRFDTIVEMQKAVVPKGLISMWSGSIRDIPKGWYLCDGKNGTPNLSGKFIRSSKNDNIGEIGGNEKITLEKRHLPPHSHKAHIESAGEHYHELKNYGSNAGDNTNANEYTRGNLFFGEVGNGNLQSINGTKKAGNHTHDITIEREGGEDGVAVPIEILPTYYTLAFIMYLGI
ncbi:hypothetical protein EDM00_11885 [Ornithobacterium rhinotracheale]|uniref:hypothetical protein n=1 Tax=Ornithobacterium rhinotracheale TaxID=28251 RepID=UPI00129C5847|nr:hypothetical protein [Ornithobacterium rhinotracheale]MRI64679.1 hypothetical protein [Ornithobacterium rhinotracheale]